MKTSTHETVFGQLLQIFTKKFNDHNISSSISMFCSQDYAPDYNAFQTDCRINLQNSPYLLLKMIS